MGNEPDVIKILSALTLNFFLKEYFREKTPINFLTKQNLPIEAIMNKDSRLLSKKHRMLRLYSIKKIISSK